MIFINTEGKAAAENMGEISEETTRKARECGVLALTYLMVSGQRIRRKGQGGKQENSRKNTPSEANSHFVKFSKGTEGMKQGRTRMWAY